MGPDPAVAAVRLAVRRVLAEVAPGSVVLAACSGGADSLALAGALAFEAARSGQQGGGVTVDHGLQEGSAERADTVVRVMAGLGLDPAGSVAVDVAGPGGPEAAARRARYEALDQAAARLGATVLLGHTLNDQAETVLLGLARGSGPRSLAGMPAVFTRGGVTYRRPFLELDRATTRRACLAMDLEPWDDPHNEDPAYTRVRVRHDALPVLEKALGPGVAEALARTARLAREDTEALDQWAADHLRALPPAPPGGGSEAGSVEAAGLAGLPRAVRTRVLRLLALDAGCPAGALSAVHIEGLERLVTGWRGQREIDLPGGVRAYRSCGRLFFR
jgi:tRNA(Ile)-lysidine synthase